MNSVGASPKQGSGAEPGDAGVNPAAPTNFPMNKIYHGDCLEVMRQWPAECVDMCVTSPPYWGLRDYGIREQLGLEKTLDEYIEKLVAIFGEVRRILRPWGTVWLNLGDSYANDGKWGGTTGGKHVSSLHGKSIIGRLRVSTGLKPKDLCMMPPRVALALQDAGWWLRSDIIWAKSNPMPESVTDRPTSSYEHIFLLTKSDRYFYDAEAVREGAQCNRMRGPALHPCPDTGGNSGLSRRELTGDRNLRNVWTITTQPYPEAHYATFPEELPRRCILAGTSAKGCCAVCGRPWTRMVEKPKAPHDGETACKSTQRSNARRVALLRQAARERGSEYGNQTKTIGWRPPTCDCNADTVPAVVLDPFFGSGTVGKVATDLGRNWVAVEISKEYIEGQARLRAGIATSEEIVSERPLFGEEL